MMEAPDDREREDCPSPAACDARCDQHEHSTVASILTEFTTTTIGACARGDGFPLVADAEASIRAIIGREIPVVVCAVDPAWGGVGDTQPVLTAVQRSKGRRW